DERSEVLDDAGEAPRGAVRIGDLRPADGAVVCRRLEEDPRPPAGVAEERLEPRDLHSRGEYGRRGRSTRGSEAVRASTSARARSQSSSSSTLKPSYPLVRNGATVRPSRVPVAKTTRVHAISSALFWTWTSGSAWYWPACQAASRCVWSAKWIRRPDDREQVVVVLEPLERVADPLDVGRRRGRVLGRPQ